MTPFNGSTVAIQVVISGSAEFTMASPEALLVARQEGANVKGVLQPRVRADLRSRSPEKQSDPEARGYQGKGDQCSHSGLREVTDSSRVSRRGAGRPGTPRGKGPSANPVRKPGAAPREPPTPSILAS